uniref:Uncharacterized protein n=1 Tax=Trichogramma kaykai TaxID=54128 RepID=A0ABD2WFX0_9HYME
MYARTYSNTYYARDDPDSPRTTNIVYNSYTCTCAVHDEYTTRDLRHGTRTQPCGAATQKSINRSRSRGSRFIQKNINVCLESSRVGRPLRRSPELSCLVRVEPELDPWSAAHARDIDGP